MEAGADREKAIAAAETDAASRRVAESPRIYDLFPPLLGPAPNWTRHLPRIAAMGFNWVHVGAAAPADEEAPLRGFIQAAGQHGLKVMTEFRRSHGAAGPTSGESMEASAARLRRQVDLGFEGFVCRPAADAPREVWAGLIAEARRESGEVRFVANTLGLGPAAALAFAGAGFDYVFNSARWWDFHSDWLVEEQQQLCRLAPTISFPESEETERLAARPGGGRQEVEAWVKLRLLFAAVLSGGWMMPIGCEYGFRRRLERGTTTPADWEVPAFDLSDYVTALNALRAKCPVLDIETPLRQIGLPGASPVALVRLSAGHAVAAGRAYLVLVNPEPGRPAGIAGERLYRETGGLLGRFADVTPLQAPKSFEPGRSLILEPLELRIFEGRSMTLEPAPGRAQLPTLRPVPELQGRRIVIENVSPEIDGGRHPAKRVVGDVLEVEADIFADGHAHLAACAKYKIEGERGWREAAMVEVDNDRWRARIPLTRIGACLYTVEAWLDEFETWRTDAGKKRAAGQNIELDLSEGLELVRRTAGQARGPDRDRLALSLSACEAAESNEERQRLLFGEELQALMARWSERRWASRYPGKLLVQVDRLAARYSAWYELFPRSQSPDPGRSGTFTDVIGRLAYVRDMGFDVLYFPPVHPIGRTNRKGRNNSLHARPDDPGSPYAIGGPEGGFTAVDPSLGRLEDFRRLVAAAHAEGLEIALDFAIQCSPDHAWLKEHPDWFNWRLDGSLRYAENPPKKYEDIVNVDFEAGHPALWKALRDVVLFWVEQGVRIFRVDNPHTKPVLFWEWMIGQVRDRHPDTIFLSEAFTRPKMMRKLAKVGFTQSYTYFTWRNSKQELTDYFTELCQGPSREYLRPNLFANTPDINPPILQTGGRPAFMMRAALAATLSSAYGIYSGFELCESAALPGREEYLDSEKYEIRRRNWDQPGNIRDYIQRLNRIRRDNPALHDFRNLSFYNAFDDRILLYGRMTPSRDNALLIAINLDPHAVHGCDFELPLWEFGLPDNGGLQVEDLIAGTSWPWHGKIQHLQLDPAANPAAIWRLSHLPS